MAKSPEASPAWSLIRINFEDDDSCQARHECEVGEASAHFNTMAFGCLLQYEQAPRFLQGNPYIRRGYRAHLSPQLCLKSMFWWTNETMNIWTHMLGLAFFMLLLLYDSVYEIPHYQVSTMDCLVITFTMILFQFSMFMSTAYHVFLCHSERAYRLWLAWDLIGVSFSIMAIFMSGIYYAYACFPGWRMLYTLSVLAVFMTAVSMAFNPKYLTDQYHYRRLVLYCTWVIYGVVPTIHWIYLNGGLESPIVQALFPRVLVMYLIIGLAFFFYVSQYPERLCPGRLDFVGASHQLWHILIIIAFYWWHNTGLVYMQFRTHYSCRD